jgi:hypothetical protein
MLRGEGEAARNQNGPLAAVPAIKKSLNGLGSASFSAVEGLQLACRRMPVLVLSGSLEGEQMAWIFHNEGPRWQSERRLALVAFLLSPRPPILLVVIVAVCGVWAVFVLWMLASIMNMLSP